jgi:tetratricopeptide (TPR) repeat protein
MGYIDFRLEVGDAGPGGYSVRATTEDESQADETAQLDQKDPELEALQLENLCLRTRRSARSQGLPKAEIKRYGNALFKRVFFGRILHLWGECTSEARIREKGVRLRLRINSTRLMKHRWEFLYDDNLEDYLSLAPNRSFVRDLPSQVPWRSLEVAGPLNVLAVCSRPADTPWIDSAGERDRIEKANAANRGTNGLELTWVEGTYESLRQALRQKPWHVIHFIGHGKFDEQRGEGVLLFDNGRGGADPIDAGDLARDVRDRAEKAGLVVLNTCEGGVGGDFDLFSSVASMLIRKGIPAVIAMQSKISDDAALPFSSEFYSELLQFQPVDSAVKAARLKLRQTLDYDWGIPILYMRAPDGVLFTQPSTRTVPVMAASPTPAPRAEPPAPLPAVADDPDRLPTTIEDLRGAFAAEGDPTTVSPERLDRVVRVGQRILELVPDSETSVQLAALHALRGKGLIRGGRFEEASADLEQAISLDGSRLDYLRELVHSRLKGGDFGGALRASSDLIQREPRAAANYLLRSVVQKYALARRAPEGDWGRRFADLDEAVRLEAGNAALYRYRGQAHREHGDHREAQDDLIQALRLDPHDKVTYEELSQVVTARGGSPEVLQRILDRIRALKGTDPNRN